VFGSLFDSVKISKEQTKKKDHGKARKGQPKDSANAKGSEGSSSKKRKRMDQASVPSPVQGGKKKLKAKLQVGIEQKAPKGGIVAPQRQKEKGSKKGQPSSHVEDGAEAKQPSKKKDKKNVMAQLKAKMKASQFRSLNEQLYSTKSEEAWDTFQKDPALFEIYHAGFREQVEKWPINPVDVFVKWLKKQQQSLVVVDFGCGEAAIAQSVKQKVHSFDLAAANEFVTACDMSSVPLESGVADVAIFSLSLMGVNYEEFLREACRVLKVGGQLKIAEVVSRFEDVDAFEQGLRKLGFKVTNKDMRNTHFFLLDANKVQEGDSTSKSRTFMPTLKACQYKKR